MKQQAYIETNKERFLDELFDLLRIPSISAQSAHKADMVRCAEWLRESLLKAGAQKAKVMPTEGNPVVYAERIIDPAKPTVLVYGHYDVMPVDPREEWRTEPFEPVVKDGRIWGRGADDDKGQLYMHAKAFETMVATDTLPCNVKFMLEGEEEIGSPSLYKWCADNKDMLAADVILVSDTSMLGMDTPSITCGLRGLAYMQVEVQGPNKDLHSGLFGGAVANPANVLTKLIASLVDENGHITIPGFYDDVRLLTPEEREAFNSAPFDMERYKNNLDIAEVEGEAGFSTMERTGVRPSLDVNGIWGGYIEEGTKTIIPAKASAKISMRLVPNQDYVKIGELFEKHFRAIAPASVKVKVEALHGGAPYVTPTDLPAYRAAERAVESTFGKKPLPFYSGGSIPIISGFERILGIKSVLMGFGLDIDAIHSP
ncbi:MAG: dipeptidase, partial [Rikenellaceae bacterium]|nr:dipeptidase [Rikenellaceae bacterium]